MDFARAIIEVNSYTDNWGPFAFDLEPGLPGNDTVSDVTVGSYLRATGADTTAYLVESGSTQVVGSEVSVRLQYPGGTRTGEHVITFSVTTTSGAKHRLSFASVLVS